MKLRNLFVLAILMLAFNLSAQEVDKKILNWYNGKEYGMSTEKAYKKVLSKKSPTKKVIVAVIDSGVDIEHEDLKDIIWVNEDEIPGNGIDDDKNGYVDDIHGWNFLGNSKGENLNDVQLEMTRIYQALDAKYKDKSYADLTEEEKKEYNLYKKVREEVEEELKGAEAQYNQISKLIDVLAPADARMKKLLGEDYTVKDLKKVKDPEYVDDAKTMMNVMQKGYSVGDLENYAEYLKAKMDFHYNKDINPRELIGDNPNDFTDVNYGNNDVEGPDAMHGTHCSGIIGAVRHNGIGMDGVADNIVIMPIRAVPNGDEQDKDIALALRYAVDNGAQVVNMSFGKAYSPNQKEVIDAIKYAEDHGVLLVHAAGNDNKDIDEQDKNTNFPTPQYPSMSERFSNWIEVGASTRYKKKLAASFSNYGNEMVDIFAPGLEIYSTVPQSDYEISQGTSMAAPMVTGLAALLKAYYPELTMIQIKEIILESGKDVSDMKTPLPGSNTVVTMGELSRTGKIANVYNAVLMAEEMTNQK